MAAKGEVAPLGRTPVPSIPTAVGPPADSVRMMIEASFCPGVLGWKPTVMAHEAPAAMALPLQVSERMGLPVRPAREARYGSRHFSYRSAGARP
jgi:hypothetical protein